MTTRGPQETTVRIGWYAHTYSVYLHTYTGRAWKCKVFYVVRTQFTLTLQGCPLAGNIVPREEYCSAKALQGHTVRLASFLLPWKLQLYCIMMDPSDIRVTELDSHELQVTRLRQDSQCLHVHTYVRIRLKSQRKRSWGKNSLESRGQAERLRNACSGIQSSFHLLFLLLDCVVHFCMWATSIEYWLKR